MLNSGTTQRCEFIKESYHREKVLRQQWEQKYDKLATQSLEKTQKRIEERQQLRQERMKESQMLARSLPELKRTDAGLARSLSSTLPPLQTTESDLSLFATSRPVSPATRTLLMTGVSANGEGRRAYLAHRRSASPEDRYLYPQTSTQAMTWGVDVLPREGPSIHGRRRIIRDTFYCKSGVTLQ